MIQNIVVCSLLLLLLLLFSKISALCSHTYLTKCDSLSDLQHINKFDNFTDEIVIGSEGKLNDKLSTLNVANLMNRLFVVTSITIINQINQLEGGHCGSSSRLYLNSMKLYKNNLSELKSGIFPNLQIRKLCLMDNKINKVHPGAFNNLEIEILDLSNNKIKSLEIGFIPKQFTLKILNLKNNLLEEIEAEAIDDSVEILLLDYNNLSYFQPGVIENLQELKVLSVKNNKLLTIPDLKDLKQIQILDFSHNSISNIEMDYFNTSTQSLASLDLSFNKISSQSILEDLLMLQSDNLTISLAFNDLANLNFSSDLNATLSLKRVTLLLYGNPWNCDLFSKVENILLNYLDKCDLSKFSDGPYCVSYSDVKFAYQHKLIANYFDENIDADSYLKKCSKNAVLRCNS